MYASYLMDQVKHSNARLSSLCWDSDRWLRRVKLFQKESSPCGRLLLAASTVQGMFGTVQTVAVSVVASVVSKLIWLTSWQVSVLVSSSFGSCAWVFLDEPWSSQPVDDCRAFIVSVTSKILLLKILNSRAMVFRLYIRSYGKASRARQIPTFDHRLLLPPLSFLSKRKISKSIFLINSIFFNPLKSISIQLIQNAISSTSCTSIILQANKALFHQPSSTG
jgi:hypothetical protein